MMNRAHLTSVVLCVACTVACSPEDPAASSTSANVAGSDAGGEGGTTTSSDGGGGAGTGAGGGGAAMPGDDNPDGLPESSAPIYSRDYDAEDAADVTSTPNIALGSWGAAFGHGPSGGWRLQPDPVSDPLAENEASAGWAWGLAGPSVFPVDAHDLVTVSYMLQVSQPLLQEIALGLNFWQHDQKCIDFKYHDPNAPYGEGGRNTIHFGDAGGEVRFSHVDGGGGQRIYFGPDWLTLADEWVWVCHVIDMRGAAAGERYMATYLKRDGDAGVTRIGIRYEDGDPVLQPYDGRGIWGFLSPIHGYWDDMVDRDGLANDLAQMYLAIDRLRVMPGWPDTANGPPF